MILPREPDQLDPRYVGDAYGLKLSRLLFASLVEIEPRTLLPRPSLASRLEQPSETEYVVELRQGLRFADGSALDAEDVVATFEALRDPAVKSRYASSYARLVEVRAEGPLRVRFRLAEPHATFVTDLEMPVLRAEDAATPRGSGPLPVASGPYVLARRDAGELRLEPNPHWALGTGSPEALRFVVIRDDNTRSLRMLGGGADLALNVIPPLLLPLFDGRPEFRVLRAQGTSTSYVGVNTAAPELRDARVRRALLMAIDRASIIRYKLGGRASLARSFVPPGHWAYADDTPQHPYDPEGAARLLDEAGHTADADGKRLSLTLRTGSDRFSSSLARALAAMWGRVGVDVEVRPSEVATLLADLAHGRFQLGFLQLPELIEPHVLSWFFASERIPLPGLREGGNRWRFASRALDEALERGRRSPDPAVRVFAYRAAQRVLATELPVLPLWHDDVIAVHSTRLRGYAVPRDARFSSLPSSRLSR